MALLIFISFFLNIQNPNLVQSVHQDFHVNQLGDISLMCQITTQSQPTTTYFNTLKRQLDTKYLPEFDTYNVLNCNIEDGIILIKNITKTIDFSSTKFKQGIDIQSVEMSWDIKIMFSSNGKINLSQENMYIKYKAKDQNQDYIEILSLEDAIEHSLPLLESKRNHTIKEIEKEIKQLINIIDRNKKSIKKERKQSRKDKLLLKISDRERRLEQLNSETFVNDLINAEMRSILDTNTLLYLNEWENLKYLVSKP